MRFHSKADLEGLPDAVRRKLEQEFDQMAREEQTAATKAIVAAAPPANTEDGPALLMHQLAERGLTGFTREFRFHPHRKWELDVACPSRLIAIEINGGVHKANRNARACPKCKEVPQGRHNRTRGYLNDLEKINAAQLLGWIVLQFTPAQVRQGRAIKEVGIAYALRGRQGRSEADV